MAEPILDLEPWERQHREGAQPFAAFALYRDQVGRRSSYKVAVELAKSGALTRRWCSHWHWLERAREYDRHLDRLARAKRETEILDYRKRAAQQSRGKAQSMMLPDMALSAKLSQPDALVELQKLSIEQLVSLSAKCGFVLPNLHKSEALALGDVTERIAESVAADDIITRGIQDDDEISSLASKLLQLSVLHDTGRGAAGAGGVRAPSEQGQVDESKPSDIPQPEAAPGLQAQD